MHKKLLISNYIKEVGLIISADEASCLQESHAFLMLFVLLASSVKNWWKVLFPGLIRQN